MKLIKQSLAAFILIIIGTYQSYAQVIPMPVYIGNNSEITYKEAVAFYLSMDLVFIFIVLVRTVLWLIKFINKKTNPYFDSFFRYVIWDSFDDHVISSLNTTIFVFINFIAVIGQLTSYIEELL